MCTPNKTLVAWGIRTAYVHQNGNGRYHTAGQYRIAEILPRLLGRVFALDLVTWPFCRRGSLRIIAALTHESVITRILRHLQLASVPPPMAPARCRQELFAFD